MICPKCQSDNISIQAVAEVTRKGKGCAYWLFIGWWLEPLLWIFLTLPMILIKIFVPNSVKSITNSYGVCQNCGNKWKI